MNYPGFQIEKIQKNRRYFLGSPTRSHLYIKGLAEGACREYPHLLYYADEVISEIQSNLLSILIEPVLNY